MLDALLEYRTDGLILVSPHLPAASIAAAAEHSPLIVLGRQMRQSTLDWVMTDEGVGAHLAVEHLVSLGHRGSSTSTAAAARAARRAARAT